VAPKVSGISVSRPRSRDIGVPGKGGELEVQRLQAAAEAGCVRLEIGRRRNGFRRGLVDSNCVPPCWM